MDGISEHALDALTAAARRAADERDLDEALRALAEAVAGATAAEAVVIRLVEDGRVVAHTVIARSEALAAELEGSSFPLAELAPAEATGNRLPEARAPRGEARPCRRRVAPAGPRRRQGARKPRAPSLAAVHVR